jgi:hypothetical protein
VTGAEQPRPAGGPARRAASAEAGAADVLHLKVDHDAQPAGVTLGQGRALLAGVTRLLQAAAMAVIGPAPRYAGRRPDVVKAFVDQDVRFAYGDATGSVLAVFTRLDEAGHGSTPHRAGGPAGVRLVPFQRRVGILAAGAVVEIVDAVREHRPPRGEPGPADAATTSPSPALPAETLRRLMLRGVSADLCDALHGMITTPRVQTLELSFYWAPRPGQDTPAVIRAALRRADADALLRLRGGIAVLPEPRQATAVYGQVTRLDRGDGDDGGVATIHGVIGRSTPRTVQVAVSGPEYDDAIRAYRTRVPVVATGRLRRHGGVHVLTGRFSVATAIVGA